MAEKRVALMVSEGVRDWVMEEIDRLCRAHERGEIHVEGYNPDTKNPLAPKLSVNAFLTMLLDQRQGHRMRSRKSKLNRRGGAKRRPSRASVERVTGESL